MDEKEYIKLIQVRNDGVWLFTNRTVYGAYPIDLFLCEIYEKLRNRFVLGNDCDEFFNYYDPKGAWELLSDFFEKTNNLKDATMQFLDEYRSRYGFRISFTKGETSELYDEFPDLPHTQAVFITYGKELDKYRMFDKKHADTLKFNPDVFSYDSCTNMIEFVFSLVHYCIYNGYVISKCAHCQKLFAVKSLKEKYCRRPSPYPGYEEYTCGEAVKSIKDRFEKRRRTEYERLRLKAAEYGTLSPHCGNFNSFCAKCDYYKNQLKKGASVELLQEYGKYLFDNPILRTKYERIKNW